MSEYTQEQIKAATAAIREADRHGACHVMLHDAETILAALERADDARESYRIASASDWERAERAEAYAAKLEKAGDTMRALLPYASGTAQFWEAARKEKP